MTAQPASPKPQPTQEDINTFCLAARDNKIAEIAKAIAAFGAGIVNMPDYLGDTALSWAVWGAHMPLMALLLDNGADIDQPERAGQAPLHCVSQAVKLSDIERALVVNLLLERGASLDPVDHNGRTPLALAEHNKCKVVADLLRAHQETLRRQAEEACRKEMERAQKEDAERLARLQSVRDAAPQKSPFKKNKPPKP